MPSFSLIIRRTMLGVQIIFALLMIVIGILSLVSPETIRSLLDWAGGHIQSWGKWNFLVLGIVAMVESFPFVGTVVPGMNIMILVGGFFVMRNWDIFPLAASIAMIGACLGNALGYAMGRLDGRERLAKYGAWIGLGDKELTLLENQIHKNGFWFIVLGKFHNLFRSFVPYIAAAQGLSGKRFWIANLVGSSLWAVSILLLGVFFVESYERILQYSSYIIIAIVIVFFIRHHTSQRSKDTPTSQ